jgi:UDP-N-acetylmuramate--alanine ligase
MGTIKPANRNVMVVDDYAHHPSEIRATLNAIRTGWPGLGIVVIFQPHRYTRTRDLFKEFCEVLAEVDALILLNVYPAGEKYIAGADSRSLADAVTTRDGKKPLLIENREILLSAIPDMVTDKDVLLIMGAGDIGSLGAELISHYGVAVG